MIGLSEIVADFALAFKAVDSLYPEGKSKTRTYKPGLGPLSEAEALRRATIVMREKDPQRYATAGPRRYPHTSRICDWVLSKEWAVEFKLLRPFGDNGVEAEHWSENLLHPYDGNVSALSDCLKLRSSGFSERRAVMIFTFEHTEPRIDLQICIRAFEKIAVEVLQINLGPRVTARFSDLVHPHHQQGCVYGWEVLP